MADAIPEPPSRPSPVRKPVFYALDSSKVTVREYWWGTPALAMPIAMLLKLLRVRVPSSTDDPNVETLRPFEVTALPPEIEEKLRPLVDELRSLGFQEPVFHAIEDHFHRVDTWLATFRHASGGAVARVHDRVWGLKNPPKDVLFTEFLSPLGSGWLWSLSSKPDLAAPPACTLVRKVGATPSELWRLHEDALAKARAARPVSTTDDVRTLVERHHAAVRAFHLARGVFRAMTPAERAEASRTRDHHRSAQAGGAAHPEILAEVQRLQARKTSWSNTLLVLLASLALFVGTSRTADASSPISFSMKDLLILVPVLFFHESGHWLAMKVFGYRNLQMFFIPFLGAAVTGRHYNVPGWKKAVVSLMGPLPGVLAGALIGILGLVIGKPLMVKVAFMALALNGFNLLPMLPLDGGWVVHALLFSRHVALDVVFRLLAVAGLVGLGIAASDKVLMYLGVFMLIALPAAYKVARITGELRRSGLRAVSDDDETIPADVVDAIAGKVKESFPRGATRTQVAQHTLSIFETLNARPPGVAASLVLGAVHAAALLGAFVVLVVLAVGQNVGGLPAALSAPPRYTLDAAAVAAHAVPGAAAHDTVVGTFQTRADAERALEHALGTGVSASLLGQTVLVVVPVSGDAARMRWLAELKGRKADTFVATAGSATVLRLTALAPNDDAAAATDEEAAGYLTARAMKLTPPWTHPDPRPAADQESHARARRTWARLQRTGAVYADPRLQELMKRQLEAQRQGDTAAVEQLRGEQRGLVADLRRQGIESVRASPDALVEVVDRYAATIARAELPEGRTVEAELAPLLGPIGALPETERAGAERHGAFGMASREGRALTFQLLFADPATGPATFVRWLHGRGFSDFRYEFVGPGPAGDRGFEDED